MVRARAESGTADRHPEVGPPWPTHDGPPVTTHLFASDRSAPRRRRPSDMAAVLLAGVSFVLLGWAASNEPPLDLRVQDALSGPPGWIEALAWVAYSGASIGAFALVLAALLGGGLQRGVLRDLVVVLGVGALIQVIAARAATGTWPHLLPELIDRAGRLAFPTVRIAFVVCVVMILGPHLTQPVRRFGRRLVVAAILGALLLGLTNLTALLGALTLAFSSVALVRVAFGSPGGLPPVDRLEAALDRLGLPATAVTYAEEQPGTYGLASARSGDGRELTVKIYGRDAADHERAERVWRALWYRGGGTRPAAGRLEQVEHEALATLAAARAGVRVSDLVLAGEEAGGDVLLVVEEPTGRRLADLDGPLPVEDVRSAWTVLTTLHDARVTHGSIGPTTVLSTAEGVAFVDLQDASLIPTRQQVATDVVSLLATLAAVDDPGRVVDEAVSVCGTERLEAVLPFVQDAVLAPTLRRRLEDTGLELDDLRRQLIDALDVEPPELAQIRRVSWSDVVMVVFAIVAANALISQIASVGFDTIADELRAASTGWLVATFVIRILGYPTAYIGLRAVVDRPLPLAPTALLQSAKTYIGLVLPSLAGRVAMDVRFLQKLGVPTAVAVAQGPVISFIGFLVEVVLLLLGAWAIGQELQSDELLELDSGGLLAIAVLVVAIGIVVVLAVPGLRQRIVPPVREALSSVRDVVSSPGRLGSIALSELLDRLVGALALAATVEAFGVDVPFMALVFVSVGTGLLAGLAPVPGGVGVAEATMTALLTAVGVDAGTAFSIAIVYRLITSYVPPVLGFFSMRWLTREGYI